MKVLDLFCGVGGASQGYALAGLEVEGVDNRPQPRYPFPFCLWDALDVLDRLDLDTDALIHASPPCQRYTPGAASWGTSDRHPDLIGPIRERLRQWGGPYVIENVIQAPLIRPVMLCGTQFDLGVFRHRNFETSWHCAQPDHQAHRGRIGDGRYHTVAGHPGGSSLRDGWRGGTVRDWRIAMGIDWANADELAQAIPPAYTQWIGERFIQDVS